MCTNTGLYNFIYKNAVIMCAVWMANLRILARVNSSLKKKISNTGEKRCLKLKIRNLLKASGH
jgi:hypothetical protein